MKTKRLFARKWLILVLFVLLMAGAGVSIVLAQTGGGYNLEWNVISSSGSMSSTAMPPHDLKGSAGQPAAGVAMTGGNYSLTGGFWAATQRTKVFIPAVMR